MKSGSHTQVDHENSTHWDQMRERFQHMHSRFEEDEKPRTLAIELSWEAEMIVEEAFAQANKYFGTNDKSKAIAHICDDYLKNGPNVRAMKSTSIKTQLQTERVEALLKAIGRDKAIKIFNRVFPDTSISSAFKDD